MGRPAVVLVDNYDSFTYNLAQAFWALGADLTVVENDRIDVAGIQARSPTHLVISPGPGTPERPADLGVSKEVLLTLGPRIPTLGVCLGHQAMVHALGGRIIRAPEVRHGKPSPIVHDGTGLYAGLPQPFAAMRYHSLIADPATLPACLQVTATTEGGLIMGLAHREWPMWGVQFHPESIGTPLGPMLLRNFLRHP